MSKRQSTTGEMEVVNVDAVYICELCQRAYQPVVTVNHPAILRTFKGYTVDMRLQQFRKVDYYNGKYPEIEFIEFTSPKGKKLLAQMHEKVTR